jgi:hypothetical protein
MKRVTLCIVVGLAALGLLTGCSDNDDSYEKVEAAHMEPIGDSGLNKVILTEKAAERVDIQMAAVAASSGNGGRKLGGTVVSPADTNGSASGGYIVAVSLTEAERAAVDSSAAAAVWMDVSGGQAGFSAMPSDGALDGFLTDPESSSTDPVLYYEIDGSAPSIAPGTRVFVEVPLADSGGARTVVPYSSIVYDLEGRTWVYVSPEPLVFQREEVEVEGIEGDIAVLSSGPPVGTEVVMTGTTELFGVESGVGGGH